MIGINTNAIVFVEEKRGKERNKKIGMHHGLFITLYFFSICFFVQLMPCLPRRMRSRGMRRRDWEISLEENREFWRN